MMRRALLACLPVVALVGVLVSPNAARPEEGPATHRALRATLFHLKAAREEVKDEKFARFRERAEKDITIAIQEIEGALREAKIDVAYEPERGWGDKWKSFRNLNQAIVELEIARKDLDAEKGEWARKKELRAAIDDAFVHTKEALAEAK